MALSRLANAGPSNPERVRDAHVPAAIKRARAFGIDVSLFRSSLDRTAEERLRRLDENARELPRLSREPGTSPLAMISGLEKAGVRFVAIGGVAAVAHGSARITLDLDICYDPAPSNADALAQVLARWNTGPRKPTPLERLLASRAETPRSDAATRLRTSKGDLDLFASVEGVGDYDACEAESEWIDVPPSRFRVLALDALIRSKRALGRDLEREALLEVELLRALIDSDSRGQIFRA